MTDKEQEEIFALETQAVFLNMMGKEIAQVIEHLNAALNNPEANMRGIKRHCKSMLEKLQDARDCAEQRVAELRADMEDIKSGTN